MNIQLTSSDYYEGFVNASRALAGKKEQLRAQRASTEKAVSQAQQQVRRLRLPTVAEKIAYVKRVCASEYKRLCIFKAAVEEASKLSDEAWAAYEHSRG